MDVNTFIPGHPASPRTRAGHANHANHDHPALARWQGSSTGIDTDHFLVQPPASVQWTLGPSSAPQLAVVPAATGRVAVLGG